MVDFIEIKKGDFSRETSSPEASFTLLTNSSLIYNSKHGSLHHNLK